MSNSNTDLLRGRRGTRGGRGDRGFTLVEILIVVIILGILAAIVIPQFSNATTDARNSNVQTQVQTVRQAIAMYNLNHNAYPDLIAGWTQLTEYTDASGNVSATADSTHVYGPYLPTAPTNPLTPTATAATTVAVDAGTPCGWIYNTAGGQFAATGSKAGYYFNEVDGTESTTKPW